LSKLIIEKLAKSYQIESFDCGVAELNSFLINHALTSLTVASVIHAGAPSRVTKGLARHPVPVMLLARLAVDSECQSQGVGKGLLKNALLKTAQAADIAGIRALLVHAKDDVAKDWYKSFDFEESHTDPLHLFLLIKDIQKIINQ